MKKKLIYLVLLCMTSFNSYSQKNISEMQEEMIRSMQEELNSFCDEVARGTNELREFILEQWESGRSGNSYTAVESTFEEKPVIIRPVSKRGPAGVEENNNTVVQTKAESSVFEADGSFYVPEIYPVKKGVRVSSPFGYRLDPFTGRPSYHAGIDIAVNTGTNILSTGKGKVVKEGYNSERGNYIIIDHGNSYKSYYGHLSKILVKKDDQVEKEQVIALSGNTGRSTGPHIHYAVMHNGKYINPNSIIH